MKKNNLVKLLGIALVVALIATGVFYGLFVNKLSSSTGSNLKMVVAAKPLKAGSTIQAADVKLIPWPLPALPKGTYGSTKDVVGSEVYDAIGSDEPIVATRLTATQSLSVNIPKGMRAVSVHVTDSTGVLELLRSGHKVDVQVVAARKSNSGEVEVRTALEDLTVLNVHAQPEQGSQGTSNPVVTLLATPAEADALAAADSTSRIRLLLRTPGDDDTQVRAALTLDNVIKDSFVHDSRALATNDQAPAVTLKTPVTPTPTSTTQTKPAVPAAAVAVVPPTPAPADGTQGGRVAGRAGQSTDRP